MENHLSGPPRMNTAGVVYGVFIGIYTLSLLIALGTLYKFRNRFEVTVRSYPLIVLSCLALHLEVAALFIVYPLDGSWTCGQEFWYMSLVLPLGIAVFAVSNVRLLQVAALQKRLRETSGHLLDQSATRANAWKVRPIVAVYRGLSMTSKLFVFVAAAFLLQVALTALLYAGSRRFSEHTGFFGVHVDDQACRMGYEWIPSVAWQFFWTLGFAPYLLFKTRGIRDVHFWAMQTRIACIASIPGTPLWLLFLYGNDLPHVNAINQWWPPAMWFAPGLIAMQLTSTIFPLVDMRQSKLLVRPTTASSASSGASSITYVSMSEGGKKYSDVASNEMTTRLATSWTAFEACLDKFMEPLKAFASEQDWTVENIVFLERVQQFKLNWTDLAPDRHLDHNKIIAMHQHGSSIFYENINPATAAAPINVPQKIVRDLYQIFSEENVQATANDIQAKIISPNIFKAAEDDVKRMTFHNTWKRFVKVAHLDLAELGLCLSTTSSPMSDISSRLTDHKSGCTTVVESPLEVPSTTRTPRLSTSSSLGSVHNHTQIENSEQSTVDHGTMSEQATNRQAERLMFAEQRNNTIINSLTGADPSTQDTHEHSVADNLLELMRLELQNKKRLMAQMQRNNQ